MSALAEPVAPDPARQREIAAALRTILPSEAVLGHADDVKPYECDGLSAYRQSPMVVALPENEASCSRSPN